RKIARPKTSKDNGYTVLLDQPACLLDRLRRAEGIVQADEGNLAAVDTALFIDHLEICKLGTADGTPGGGRTAVGRRLAYLDLGVGHTGYVAFLRGNGICNDSGNAARN